MYCGGRDGTDARDAARRRSSPWMRRDRRARRRARRARARRRCRRCGSDGRCSSSWMIAGATNATSSARPPSRRGRSRRLRRRTRASDAAAGLGAFDRNREAARRASRRRAARRGRAASRRCAAWSRRRTRPRHSDAEARQADTGTMTAQQAGGGVTACESHGASQYQVNWSSESQVNCHQRRREDQRPGSAAQERSSFGFHCNIVKPPLRQIGRRTRQILSLVRQTRVSSPDSGELHANTPLRQPEERGPPRRAAGGPRRTLPVPAGRAGERRRRSPEEWMNQPLPR